MLKSIDKIGNRGEFSVCEDLDGKPNHRRTLSPGSDISTEPPEVQAACEEAWTPEVVEAYQAHLEIAV